MRPLALLATALGACGSGTNHRTAESAELDPATTEVALHFHDSSVPRAEWVAFLDGLDDELATLTTTE